MAPTLSLLKSRRLWPLCLSQACGAFNDNLAKNAMIVLAMFAAEAAGAGLSVLAGALFIAPYMFLSATAGQLADRFDKSRLIRWLKAAEVVLMGVSAVGFLTGSVPMLLAVLFGLGVQSAMFGPVKYGILPDHLRDDELVSGNGLVEASTFLAILLGTIGGGALVALDGGAAIVSCVGIAVSLLGLVSAFAIPAARPADPSVTIGWNVAAATFAIVRQAAGNRPVWLSILGISWFWAFGATLLAMFPAIARDTLGGEARVFTLLLTAFAVGVGAGSVLCAKMLGGEVSARYVPFAAFGLSIFGWDFGSAVLGAEPGSLASVGAILGSPTGWRMMADLLLLAACGGAFSVPLYAIIQERSPGTHRSRMVAANNAVNAVLMVAGAGATFAAAAAGLGPAEVVRVAAALNLLVALWIVRLLPQDVFRTVFRAYFLIFHRAKVRGLENLDNLGDRAVFVINHQSFLDGCFVAAFVPGDLVFAVNTEQARRFWFLKAVIDMFPVDPANPMATKSMVRAVKSGRRLAIFPEGRITLTGTLMKVYDGPGLIADKADADLVPINIDGLRFHKSSRMKGKLPLRWFPRLSLTILPPRKVAVPAHVVGRARREALALEMYDTMAEASFRPEAALRTLWTGLIDARERFDMGRPVVADITPNDRGGTTRTELTYGKLILAATVLGRKLAGITERGEIVGVMLPNSVGMAATFFGLQSQARVTALMNFTTGADAMLACVRAAEMRTILTSRRFVEKAKLGALVEAVGRQVEFVYLEDVRASITRLDKFTGLLAARNPGRLPGAAVDPMSPAVVIFTSGSEGQPKGVVHSHFSLMANCAQVATVVDFNPVDRVFNALPMFHSFGLTGGTLMPLMNGVRTFLYPSPLHYKIVPEMVYDEQSTIMFGTDSFLSGYARKGHAMDFQSLRYIFAGAEKVRPETRAAYMAHFRKPIFEGYGATETGPVLALNTVAHSRDGTVGRLLPGLTSRLEAVPGIEEGGRLWVKGPNVMLGYLKADMPGVVQPPEDGWYDTGDIVAIDGQGFVAIKGRAKRFAKVAGEMVSLSSAEALANAIWKDSSHAVVTLPDPRKGERLLLVTTQRDAAARTLLAAARERGVAEIMVARDVMVVDRMPLLGTGKVDYPAVQRLAEARASSGAAPEAAEDAMVGA